MKTKLLPLAFLAMLAPPASQGSNELPVIGDTASAIVSLDEEFRIGRAWVRTLRAQAPLLNDPLVYSYTDNLLSRLATFSPLQDRRLSLVLLENSSLNAFAVPGGIIGVHGGLFLYASTESEFASVLAHELAHLSQRHHAMTLEAQQRNLPWQLAATLASILIAAKSDGAGGTAALVTSQAASQQQSLAFSRDNEREADRIGMQVLADAGYTPRAMPKMFGHMQRQIGRAGRNAPEFLLTHPVTEARVADALNRSEQLPSEGKTDSLEYQLIQTRVKIHLAKNLGATYARYRAAVRQFPTEPTYYGLALSAIRNNHFEEAREAIDWLLEQSPDRMIYRIAEFEYWLATRQGKKALPALAKLLEVYPGNHALTMLFAQTLTQQGHPNQAVELLRAHSRRYPQDMELWYTLAEAEGLANNILGVHLARAEYYLLKGAVRRAENHLEVALKLPELSQHDRLRIEQRLKDAKQIRQDLEF
ncbi:M48 family metalloprotease [Motiliproteus sp. SC1-56]|uniref:M48 family metalloprotease n=1 Tax=Motiliproteus sp. SC1-56 TaxID=2799565 RepID=UPI001A8C6B2F|nr:M48 family metalloprotease [Motiliproteus sp. SC1-56]